MQAWVPGWLNGRKLLTLDIHCPFLRGEHNEWVYQVGSPDAEMWARQVRFGGVLERTQRGTLAYRKANDLPYGKSWNTATGRKQGRSMTRWASTLPGNILSTSLELPYAKVLGREVNQTSARELGRDLAAAFKVFVEETDHPRA